MRCKVIYTMTGHSSTKNGLPFARSPSREGLRGRDYRVALRLFRNFSGMKGLIIARPPKAGVAKTEFLNSYGLLLLRFLGGWKKVLRICLLQRNVFTLKPIS